jgi:hypothetical protein
MKKSKTKRKKKKKKLLISYNVRINKILLPKKKKKKKNNNRAICKPVISHQKEKKCKMVGFRSYRRWEQFPKVMVILGNISEITASNHNQKILRRSHDLFQLVTYSEIGGICHLLSQHSLIYIDIYLSLSLSIFLSLSLFASTQPQESLSISLTDSDPPSPSHPNSISSLPSSLPLLLSSLSVSQILYNFLTQHSVSYIIL